MTTTAPARPRTASTPQAAIRELARIEAVRMLRHPAPWIGLAGTVWFAGAVFDQMWAAAHYQGLVAATAPLLVGVTVAAISAFTREHTAVSAEAPVGAAQRSAARLLGGLALVALVAAVVAAVVGWLQLRGGLALGDEPGRTEHAFYTFSELLQPVLLAALAVSLAAALAHVVRHRLAASIVAFVFWFLVCGTYWMFNGPVLRWLTPVQMQPIQVDVGPAATDPTTFPASWLLSVPGEHQPGWVRLVVSPELAAWHDVYLVALTVLLAAVAVPGRFRRPVVVAALVLGAGAVLLQRLVTP